MRFAMTTARINYPDAFAERSKRFDSLTDVLLINRSRHARLQNVTVRLPLLHNPSLFGLRLPIGLGKFRQTFSELKAVSPGFNVSTCLGWCTEDGMWDPHLRVDFDVDLTPDLEAFLIWWREFLRRRFAQRSIYMATSPITWIP